MHLAAKVSDLLNSNWKTLNSNFIKQTRLYMAEKQHHDFLRWHLCLLLTVDLLRKISHTDLYFVSDFYAIYLEIFIMFQFEEKFYSQIENQLIVALWVVWTLQLNLMYLKLLSITYWAVDNNFDFKSLFLNFIVPLLNSKESDLWLKEHFLYCKKFLS